MAEAQLAPVPKQNNVVQIFLKGWWHGLAVANKLFFSIIIAVTKCSPALFWILSGLVNPACICLGSESSSVCYHEFAMYFGNKITRIWHSLVNTTFSALRIWGLGKWSLALPIWIILNCFHPLIQRICLEGCKWLAVNWLCACKIRQERLGPLPRGFVNTFLCGGRVLGPLKSVTVWPLPKKPSLNTDSPFSCYPVSSLPFLGKVIERVVAEQLQGHPDAMDFLETCQAGFHPGYSTRTVLMAFANDPCLKIVRGTYTLLIYLIFL